MFFLTMHLITFKLYLNDSQIHTVDESGQPLTSAAC